MVAEKKHTSTTASTKKPTVNSASKKDFVKKPPSEKKPFDKSAKKPFSKSSNGKTKDNKPFSKDHKKGGPKKPLEAAGAYDKSKKPDSPLVASLKLIWNKLRVKNNDKPQVLLLANDLFDTLKGHVLDVARKHDASRIIQAALQFCTLPQKMEVVKELDGHIFELSKLQYSHFIVLKLFKSHEILENVACRKILVKGLKGNVNVLGVHSVGSRVVEVALQELTELSSDGSKQADLLRKEFYGKQYSIFDESSSPMDVENDAGTSSSANAKKTITPSSLNNKIMTELTTTYPDAKEGILNSLLTIIHKSTTKGLLSFQYIHDLLHSYLSYASPEEIAIMASSNLTDNVLPLLSTRPSSIAVTILIAYASAKDRKKVQKTLKGFVSSSLMHRDAYLPILRLIESNDDTVTTQKAILSEIIKPTITKDKDGNSTESNTLLAIALEPNASKVLLMLLSDELIIKSSDPMVKATSPISSNFDPYEIALLSSHLSFSDGTQTSKKQLSTRRSECRQFIKSDLINLTVKHTQELLESKTGAVVLRYVIKVFGESASGVFDSVVELFAKNKKMFEDPKAHILLKKMLIDSTSSSSSSSSSSSMSSSSASSAKNALTFINKFKGQLVEIAVTSNRGAFVIEAICGVGEANKELEVGRKGIEEAAKKGGVGAKAVLGKMGMKGKK